MSGNDIIRREILAYSRNPRRNLDHIPTPIPKRKMISMLRFSYENPIEVSCACVRAC